MKKAYLVPSLESIDLNSEKLIATSNDDSDIPTVNPGVEGDEGVGPLTNKKHGIFDESESEIWKN